MALFDRQKPYQNLPLLPPRAVLESPSIYKQLVSASRALAELKGAGDLIPNQAVLLTTLALKEAKLSSEIENIVTTNDELYKALADEDYNQDPATKEVLSYNQALWFGYNTLRSGRPLSTRLFEEIVARVKPNSSGIRTFIGTKIASQHGVIYTPPEGEKLIRDLLQNLEIFLYNNTSLDPLIKMALMHYQFEAIHPFADGNGRTGRILNILYLIEEQLLEIPVLYLSSYIMKNKTNYYQGLRQVTENDAWESWVLYMLSALEQTALATKDKILGIRNLIAETDTTIKEKLPGIHRKELTEILFQQPYCKIKFLEEGLGLVRQTASNYLKQLEKIGVLKGTKRGREWYYLNVPFFDLLTQ
jgi:Fic family protein